MQRKYRHLILAYVLFLISEVFAALIIYNLLTFDYIIWSEEMVPKSTWNSHVWIMAVTMIILNGHGMVIFRLMPRLKTQIVKYIHAFIHTMIIGGSMYAYYDIHIFMNDNDHPHFTFEHLHTYLALLTAIVYLIQWVTGIFVYLYLYSNQRRRKLFASWHNFIGICILQLSIATACVQLQEMNYEINTEEQHAEAAMMFMVIYGVLINAIVLNPYLEWRLVGPL